MKIKVEFNSGGAGGDASGGAGGFEYSIRGEVVGIGIAGSFAGKDANADAQRDSLSGGFNQGFIEADGTRGEVFEVKVGIIAAFGEGFGEVTLKVAFRQAELLPKKVGE